MAGLPAVWRRPNPEVGGLAIVGTA